jgi:hypothetical protein
VTSQICCNTVDTESWLDSTDSPKTADAAVQFRAMIVITNTRLKQGIYVQNIHENFMARDRDLYTPKY